MRYQDFLLRTDKNLQLMKLLSEKYVFGTVMLRLVENFADEAGSVNISFLSGYFT